MSIKKKIGLILLAPITALVTVVTFWKGSVVGSDGKLSSRKCTALACFTMFVASWYMHVFQGVLVDTRFIDYTFLGALVSLGIITMQNIVDIITGKKNYIFSDKTNVFGRTGSSSKSDDEIRVSGGIDKFDDV